MFKDRAQSHSPRQVKNSPGDKAIRNIGTRNAEGVSPDHRLFKRDENLGRGIQITAIAAPDVGKIQIGAANGLRVKVASNS